MERGGERRPQNRKPLNNGRGKSEHYQTAAAAPPSVVGRLIATTVPYSQRIARVYRESHGDLTLTAMSGGGGGLSDDVDRRGSGRSLYVWEEDGGGSSKRRRKRDFSHCPSSPLSIPLPSTSLSIRKIGLERESRLIAGAAHSQMEMSVYQTQICGRRPRQRQRTHARVLGSRRGGRLGRDTCSRPGKGKRCSSSFTRAFMATASQPLRQPQARLSMGPMAARGKGTPPTSLPGKRSSHFLLRAKVVDAGRRVKVSRRERAHTHTHTSERHISDYVSTHRSVYR